MLTSAELRWFSRGTLPVEVSHWFALEGLGDCLAPPEQREDVYLYTEGCEYLGIKLRQGRLEIKWRQAEFGNVRFGLLEGKAEKWGKWLCEDPTEQSFQPASVSGQKVWVGVRKVRSQRQYQVLPDASPRAVPIDELLDQGCSVEITQLQVGSNDWWSLAFEAIGKDDRLMANLQSVANWVFKSYRGPQLLLENSYAYPSWLSVVAPGS
ncbi:MAG: hypothetical protein JOZ78_09790 [Chroococcidiopsidaceae cyanobacterium CP_BM_ER_R8_30]|nr:hypothetical protein [Chroococcidiopsidaceae cyanobacterium CP_BM_ER_R8_30]